MADYTHHIQENSLEMVGEQLSCEVNGSGKGSFSSKERRVRKHAEGFGGCSGRLGPGRVSSEGRMSTNAGELSVPNCLTERERYRQTETQRQPWRETGQSQMLTEDREEGWGREI